MEKGSKKLLNFGKKTLLLLADTVCDREPALLLSSCHRSIIAIDIDLLLAHQPHRGLWCRLE